MNSLTQWSSGWTQASWVVFSLLSLSACNTGSSDTETSNVGLSNASPNVQVAPADTGSNDLNTNGTIPTVPIAPVAPVSIRRCAPDSMAARLKPNQGGSCTQGGV